MIKKTTFIIALIMSIFLLTISGCSKNSKPPQQRGTPQSYSTPQAPQPQPPSVSPPAEAVPKADTVLGSFQTKLLDKDPDRINNISIAAEEINNYVIQPGEVFSFNDVIGKRKAENGYEKAKIIVNGKRKEGIGGGICQLSTTLYNAVQNSGLEVVERHPHSNDVHYVPKGQDAAVNYGTLDFKFRNTKSYPVKVQASVGKEKVYVTILSAP